eukprot:2954639-Amphidinium_carterae.1
MLPTAPDQEGRAMSGAEDSGSNPDVRVDDTLDRSGPVAAEVPEVLGATCRVGPHICHITAGDTRMTCKKCGRYVTSYKGTWRNLGTIARQPCKPKARRLKGYEGKAAHKQSGGALPALLPGSRPRGRAPGPNKKARTQASQAQVARFPPNPLSSEAQSSLGQAQEAAVSHLEEPGGSSGAQELTQCALCREEYPELKLQDRVIRDQ